MSNAAVSVILPVYNIEEYLPACMESLFAQTYTDFEIILVDDGSNEICRRLCDSYKKHPCVAVYHKENGGLSDARNYGLEHADGDWIIFIDPDDWVDPDYIAYLKSLVDRYGTKMAISQHRVILPGGRVRELGREGEDCLDDRTCIERMLYHDVIDTSAWGKIYRRDLFQTIRYPYGRWFEDVGTTYALIMEAGRIAVGYRSTYNYIYRKDSIVNRTFNLHKIDMMVTTDSMAKSVLSAYPDLRSAVIRRRVYSRFSTLNQMLDVKGYDDLREEIIRFIKKYSKYVLSDPKAPLRDKIAIRMLEKDYAFYRTIWQCRKRIIYREGSLLPDFRLCRKQKHDSEHKEEPATANQATAIPLDLKGIKRVEKGLLREFVRICDENGFYYTLCGGTMLGSIRHKGFIPWDDDIDVFMPRPDYDRLLNGEADLSFLPEHVRVVSWKNGSNYPFIKLIDTRTDIVVDYFDERCSGNNIWIDVLPMDGNSDDPRKCAAACMKTHFLRHMLTLKMSKTGEGKNRLKALLKPAIKFLLRAVPMHYLCRRIDEVSKSFPFEGGKTVCCIMWGCGPREAIDREQYMTPILKEFEGDMYPVPSNYDEYLSNLYGDYMKLPPVDKRVVHGIKAVIHSSELLSGNDADW